MTSCMLIFLLLKTDDHNIFPEFQSESNPLSNILHIFSMQIEKQNKVVPFITVWALICFLPEICRIILSVKMLFFWLTEISLASDNWTCENSIFSIFSLFSGQHFVTLQIHYTAIENANIAFHKVENNVFMHSNVSFKHSNYVDIVYQSNAVSYEISVHICLILDFFQNSRFSTLKI